MTTAQWQTRIDVSTDAHFRAWGVAFDAALTSLGLVKTSDTGQVDWNTATWTANVVNGYEVWRFNDALQATAPIFLKFRFYRSGFGGVPPMLFVTVGTGSNGSGTLTGTTTAEVSASNNQNPATTYAVHYASMVNGKFSLAMAPASGSNETFLLVHRTNDSAGDPTATGCIIVYRGNVTNALAWITCINFVTPAVTQTQVQGYNAIQLGNLAATAIGTNYRGSILVGAYPQALPHIGVVGYIEGMYAQGATFKATPFGATEHTYIAMQGSLVYLCSTQRIAFLWE
jgi:hypothetical protein